MIAAQNSNQEQDPRQGAFFVRLFRGAAYLLRGYSFVFKGHPGLLKLCAVPLLINLALFAAAAAALYMYGGDAMQWLWPRPDTWWFKALWYVLYIFMVIVLLLLCYVLIFAVQGVLSAPFNDLLSERVEQLAYGIEPPPFALKQFVSGVAHSLGHEVYKQGIYVASMGGLLLLKLVVPVVGSVIMLVGGVLLSALFFCYEFMDFAMARRYWTWADKWRFIQRHRSLNLGFGSALAAVMMVPLLGSLSLPMAAVGGTLLFCDLERFTNLDGRLAGPDGAASGGPASAGEPAAGQRPLSDQPHGAPCDK